jgi:Beta-lactamase
VERAPAEKITGAAAYISFGAPGPAIQAFDGKTGRDSRDPPVRQNTLFQMGSTSKSFTAAVILKLEAAGKLSLDGSVRATVARCGLPGKMAMTISFARHQFPPVIIWHAVWLYVRFTLSYRDVEDLLAERDLDVTYETVRRWVLKFGPMFAQELRRRRRDQRRGGMAVVIAGRQFWLWRSVEDEGEVLDLLVQRRRD